MLFRVRTPPACLLPEVSTCTPEACVPYSMRQRLIILITAVVVVGLLIALNAASYVKVEGNAESEMSPDRSTFNAGATGTRALFDFLRESGYQVARWRDSTAMLLSAAGPKPTTVVVVGQTIVPFSNSEREELLRWVAKGGRLVIIDRHPDASLLPASGEWRVSSYTSSFPAYDLDPDNLEQMTVGVKPASPSQPTLLARDVETILPSRFAGTITIASSTTKKASQTKSGNLGKNGIEHGRGKDEESSDDSTDYESEDYKGADPKPSEKSSKPESPAPVVNFVQSDGSGLLVDYPHGKGRIALLSDPFIVANNGISREDNLQLAINLVTDGGGLVAFDEFHQGRGATHNALIQYFEGTPILALFGQLALIALTIVWSRGRRFARPLPLPQVDRRSSLEFVASMAELQQRARAHDLALENIYGRVRRVLVRYAGLNNSSPRTAIAARVAARSGLKQQQLETLMRNCEETINGAPTTAKEALGMAKRLRQIENRLGLGSRARDVRQTAEKSNI